MQRILTKLHSLVAYVRAFRNWWQIAFARYLRPPAEKEIVLDCRSGGQLRCRPYCDWIAIGEVFAGEQYAPFANYRDARVVWDVGGNIGCFPVWCAKYLPQAQYHSFEPAPETFALLEQNRVANPAINWSVYPYGLAARNSVEKAFVPGGMFAEASTFAREGKEIAFELRDIQEIWGELGQPRIDLLKIDCEGGEYAIFERMPDEVLRQITCLVVELHPIEGKDPGEIVSRLRAAGFRLDSWGRNQQLIYARRQP